MSDTFFYFLIASIFWILPGYFVYKNIPDKKEVSIIGIVLCILPIVNLLIFTLISRDKDAQQHEEIVQQLQNNKLRYVDELLNLFEEMSSNNETITLEKFVYVINDWIYKDLNLKAQLRLMNEKEREKVNETIDRFIENVILQNQAQLLMYLHKTCKPEVINEILIKSK